MRAHDVTGKQLAAALHMSQGSLSERLSGEVRFSADEVAGIAAFFDLPTGVLFADPRETLKTRSDKSAKPRSEHIKVVSSRPEPDRRYKSKGNPMLVALDSR